MTRSLRVVLDYIRSAFGWASVAVLTFLYFFPLTITFLVIVPFDRDRKRLHVIVSSWARAILVVCPFMRVHIESSLPLKYERACVLVANHQSLADILVVLQLAHPFKFIAKKELFWIPFLGWALSVAGYIHLARASHASGRKTMKRASEYVRRGTTVLFFPEGTRSRDGEIHDFKVGAFKIASDHDVPVVPIVINGTRDIIKKGSTIVSARRSVTLHIGRPHVPHGKDSVSITRFLNEVRSEMIQALAKLRASERVW